MRTIGRCLLLVIVAILATRSHAAAYFIVTSYIVDEGQASSVVSNCTGRTVGQAWDATHGPVNQHTFAAHREHKCPQQTNIISDQNRSQAISPVAYCSGPDDGSAKSSCLGSIGTANIYDDSGYHHVTRSYFDATVSHEDTQFVCNPAGGLQYTLDLTVDIINQDCTDEELCPGDGDQIDYCDHQESNWWSYDYCNCVTSPIIIDLTGNGLPLTGPANGVWFDLSANGVKQHVSWTAQDSADAFLVLDRNGNGVIDDGRELFGTVTDQPPSDEKNGFRALAVFDQNAQGGNGDGKITNADAIFDRLRLWIDRNHDGRSQASELIRLADARVLAIDLSYAESKHTDQYGDLFRYKSHVLQGTSNGVTPHWAVDVFLVHSK